MKIIKHSDIVDFDPEKLRKSLVKSGARVDSGGYFT
jgi:hypothetical protein